MGNYRNHLAVLLSLTAILGLLVNRGHLSHQSTASRSVGDGAASKDVMVKQEISFLGTYVFGFKASKSDVVAAVHSGGVSHPKK